MLSALALVVALTGATPVSAAVHAVRLAVFARNAGAVDGLKASRTPQAGRLVALDRHAKLPVSALPAVNARTLDGLQASTTPEPGQLLALSPVTGTFPQSVIPTATPMAAEISLAANLTVPSSQNGTDVALTQVVYDTAGMHSAADPRILTAPVPGYCVLNANVGWLDTGNAQTDGTTRACEIELIGGAGGALARAQQPPLLTWQDFSGIAHLAAGNSVYLNCNDDATAPVQIEARDDAPTSLAMLLVAPDD
jgi:hypothetical protein